MSIEENKAIVRRYQAAYDNNNLDDLDAVIAVEMISHAAAYDDAPTGLEGAKFGHRQNLSIFPEFRQTIDLLIAEGDKVVMRFTASGTFTGEPLMGVPPTGRRFEITGISIYRIAGGKIVEHWAIEDEIGIMQQIGLMPAPG